MNNDTKHEIIKLIESEKQRSGSYSNVAVRCGVSTATISQMINQNWELIRDQKWNQVAASLGHGANGIIKVVTTNYKAINDTLNMALQNSIFVGISAAAGSGKTVALKSFTKDHSNVYYMEVREWAKREFLRNMAKTLGLQSMYYHTSNQLEEQIIQYFVKNTTNQQMLIIDQANSLKLSSMKFFIHLYNAMKGRMAIILAGTDALEHNIKKGVYKNINGFDELDSRIGRNFIHLLGSTKKDIQAICEANGINDKNLISEIFTEAGYVFENIGTRTIKVVKDLRRIERIILRERIKLNNVA